MGAMLYFIESRNPAFALSASFIKTCFPIDFSRAKKSRFESLSNVLGTPFLLVYRIHKGRLEILALIHGARRWLDSF